MNQVGLLLGGLVETLLQSDGLVLGHGCTKLGKPCFDLHHSPMGWRHFAHLQELGRQVGTGFAGHDRKEQWLNLRKSGAESLEQLLAAAASHETWLLVGHCSDQWKCMVDWAEASCKVVDCGYV